MDLGASVLTLLFFEHSDNIRRGILKFYHSRVFNFINCFLHQFSDFFIKVWGWNERVQRELSNKPIKSDFKTGGIPLFLLQVLFAYDSVLHCAILVVVVLVLKVVIRQ